MMLQTRKKWQQTERQAHIRSSALEAAANSIILTNKAGIILFANKAFCAMTGYTPEEVLGKTPDFLKSGKHDAVFFKELWETILAGRVWQGEIINRRKNGTLYNEDMTITPIREAGGEIGHFIAIKKDITQHIRSKEQLHHMQKMEAVGQLAGGIAHDFNNLLTIIHGNAQLVLFDGGHLTEEDRRCLQQITDSTERAANLTRQLLAFGRKQNFQFQPLNLSHVLGNFTRMLKRVVGEHVELQCNFAENLPPISADVGMIEQILINLIVNARDAMPAGGSITVTTEAVGIDAAYVNIHPEAQPGNFVCFSVSDTGTGIYPEYLPRIFEPFFTTKESGKGTGLGLATVYGIVKQHQGWIDVSSQLGCGTAFKIFLPASVSAVAEKGGVSTPARRPVGHEKILLVEDDGDVRKIIRNVLEASGYHVWEAADGLEALDIWKANAPQIDLLLTDVIMPGGLSGRELADRLQGERPGLKVILMSGYSPELLGKIQVSNRILPKPFSLEELTQAVRSCLDTASPAG
jgi:PAS domain S-box-containing protein